MANQNSNPTDDLEFEDMMKERFDESLNEDSAPGSKDERFKEMNKKLPSWDLEPPFTYLK